MTDAHTTLDSPSNPDAELDTLRRQAKQRFIGAAVLVLATVIAFPFVLESTPRPLPANIVIDIPKAEAKTELAAPAQTVQPEVAANLAPVAVAPSSSTIIPPTSAEPKPAKNTPLAFAPEPAKSEKLSDGARAEALLSGAGTGKYIVQAGSFKEDDKLQAAMSKLSQAGIKHYTQAAKGKDGTPRTRLRLSGTFETREEANAAAAKVAKLGVASIVLKP
jgi:DedD protein